MEPGCQGSQWPESGWNLWFKIGKKSSKLSLKYLKLKHRNCLWFFWAKKTKPMVYRCVSSFFGWKLPSNGVYRIPNLSDKPIDDRCNTEMEECRKLTILRLPETGSDIDYLIVTIQPDFPYWGNHKTCTLSSSVITTHSDQLNRNSELWSIAQTQSSVSKRFQICQSHCKAWDASAMLSEGESTLATHLQSSLWLAHLFANCQIHGS